MPATNPTLLARIMDAVAENVAAVENVAGTAQLFGGTDPADWDGPTPGPATRTTRIYLQGEPIPEGGPFPLAIIRFEDEDFIEELEQTTKRGHLLPWSIEVHFDLNPETEPDAHPTLRDIQTNLIGQVKDRLGTDAVRRLPQIGFGATVVDNGYQGGGAKLTPLDTDAEGAAGSARYAFVMRYLALYRHAPADSKTPV